jgi:pyrroline-5-carboxylate reductase
MPLADFDFRLFGTATTRSPGSSTISIEAKRELLSTFRELFQARHVEGEGVMSEAESKTTRWGFIGAGRMATALIRGMLRAGTATRETIIASDPLESARTLLATETGVTVVESNVRVAHKSEVLVLAVKPQTVPHVLEHLRHAVTPEHLIISIAAGVALATLEAGLGPGRRLVRVMPNTPALIGAGASAYCLGSGAGAEDQALVLACLKSVGQAVPVPEALLDAVTGLSGSGPAFVFVLIEALSDGGVKVGLPRDVATALAAQTVLGAARMVLETGTHPGVLKDQVASPGGTTIAGLHALERGGLRAALIDAVEAATFRSAELARLAAGTIAQAPKPDKSQ